MADENTPQHSISHHHDDESSTTRATQRTGRALPSRSDDAQGAATHGEDAEHRSGQDEVTDETVVEQPVADAQPAQGKTEDIDPETRMLQQIAALKADEPAGGPKQRLLRRLPATRAPAKKPQCTKLRWMTCRTTPCHTPRWL